MGRCAFIRAGVHLWGQVCIYKGRWSSEIVAFKCLYFKTGTLLRVRVFWGGNVVVKALRY